LQKTINDGIVRATTQYVTYNTSETGYPYPVSVTNDTVFQQTELSYDAAGNLIQRASRQRMHDASGTGELANPSTSPTARVSYLTFYPDAIGREQARADYGTNGASSFTRSATIPTRSDTVLVASISYNSRGEAYQNTDPKGKITQLTIDDAGRMTVKVEDYGTGHLNRETDYGYTADGTLKTLTVKNSDTGDQVTQYVYGTTLTDSDVASNDLLRAVIYPDSDDVASPLGNGSDGIYDRVEFKYNRLEEPKERKPAPVKLVSTWVKVPPVELDCSRRNRNSTASPRGGVEC